MGIDVLSRSLSFLTYNEGIFRIQPKWKQILQNIENLFIIPFITSTLDILELPSIKDQWIIISITKHIVSLNKAVHILDNLIIFINKEWSKYSRTLDLSDSGLSIQMN